MPPLYRVRLLGQLCVLSPSGELVVFPGRKIAALFGALCLEPGHALSREFLAEALWPTLELANKQTRLRQELLVLRRLVGDASEGGLLVSTRTHIAVRTEGIETDYSQFQAAWKQSQGSPLGREAALLELVALYHGDLLESADEFAEAERRWASQVFEKAVRQLVPLLEAASRVEEAIALLDRVVERDLLNEELHQELMRLYAVAGQPNLVWRQYERLEQATLKAFAQKPESGVLALALRLRQEASKSILLSATPSAPVLVSPAVVPPPPAIHSYSRWGWGGGVLLLVVGLGLWLLSMRRVAAPVAQVQWSYLDTPQRGEKPNSEAKAVVATPTGLLCATGMVDTDKEDTNVLTMAFSSEGKLLWRKTYDSPGHDCDRAFSVAADRGECFYVAGESFFPSAPGQPEGWHLFLLKYHRSGQLIWAYHSLEITKNDGKVCVVVDEKEGAYLAGTALLGNRRAPFVTHVNGEGHALWSRALVLDSEATWGGLSVGPRGESYLGGTVEKQPKDGNDWVVAAFSPTGTLRWQKTLDGPDHGEDHLGGLSTDRFSALYVVGISQARAGGSALAVVKLAESGALLWRRDSTNRQLDLHLESANLSATQHRLALTGFFTHGDGSVEALVEQYDNEGNLRWQRPLRAAAPDRSLAPAQVLADDRGGALLTALLTKESQFNIHLSGAIYTMKLDPDGNVVQQLRFHPSERAMDVPTGMVGSLEGALVIVGQHRTKDPETAAFQVISVSL